MAIFPKCCCCDLKTGNVILGSLCLFVTGFVIGNSIQEILLMPLSTSNQQQEDLYNATMMSIAIYIVLCLLYIPASICLIVGALKANSKLIAVFLFVDVLNIVLVLLKMIVFFALFGFDLGVMIICLVCAAIFLLIWLFPFSLWQQSREGQDTWQNTQYMPANK